ncbi:hypothetical protein [Streptomyces klenkii]|uniref:hypothetical protein n=1 Tax=Streptomyces klenkii TaxID=1420899 RepID=UPI00343BF543
MSNEIIRHPRLSSDAARLLTWQLSLPEGIDQPLSETAKRAGIKKTGFIRAKRQLAAEGYFHEWRRQGEGGRWSTTQLISNVPLSAQAAIAVRDGRPAGHIPAVGQPENRPVGRSQKNTEQNIDNPPSPPPASANPEDAHAQAEEKEELPSPEAPEPTPGVPAVPGPLAERSALALAVVSHGERRLRLSGRELASLAPLVGEWFHRGAAMADLREALTDGLPSMVHSPAGLIRHRLLRKMPPVPTFAEQRAAELRATGRQSRLSGTRECQGEHVQAQLFRPVADEVLCPQCRHEVAAASQNAESGSAAAATLRGAITVRTAANGVT